MTCRSLTPQLVALIKHDLLTHTSVQVSLKHSVSFYVVDDIRRGRTYTGIKKTPKPRKPSKPRCDRQLDDNTVARIKRDLITMTTSAVAKKYELGYSTVYSIHTKATYREIAALSASPPS